MNRSTDMQILAKNPEANEQVTKAIRKGIVKGMFALKNPKESEAEIRKVYKIPSNWKAVWTPDGSVVFEYGNESAKVTPDGEIDRK